MRTIGSSEEWKDHFPPYQEKEIVERIQIISDHRGTPRSLPRRKVQGSPHQSWVGRELEEVGDTLAIFGEFDNALSIACDSTLEAFRQQGLWLVLVIELFRRRRIEEVTTFLMETGVSRA